MGMRWKCKFIFLLFHNLDSPNKIKIMKEDEMNRDATCMGERRKRFKILVGKPEGNRPHGGLKHRCEDNIKMDDLAQDRFQWQAVVNTVMNRRVP
jgi:hypothetical protein